MSDTTQLQFVHNAPDKDSWHDTNMWNNVKKSGTNDLGYSYTKLFNSLYNYWARTTADAGLKISSKSLVVRCYLDPIDYKLNIHNEQ